MSEFKMSDVFDLPVNRVEGGVYPMLYSADDNLVFVSKADYVDAAAIAINSHDKLTEQVKLMREALTKVISADSFHYQDDAEYVEAINHAKEALEATK